MNSCYYIEILLLCLDAHAQARYTVVCLCVCVVYAAAINFVDFELLIYF